MEIDFYYLRTPTFSLQRLLNLLQQDDLTAFAWDPLVGEAIFLASPTLYGELQADPVLSNKKLRQTVLKYMLRMGSRSTPFGLFAGCSLGQSASGTSLDVSNRQLICHHELNTTIVWELFRYLNQQAGIRSFIHYQVNSSLYTLGNHYRYLEFDQDSPQPRFFTSQITNHPPFRFVLRKARKGATIAELIYDLIERGYPQKQAQAYVDQLIVDQVLVSKLALNGTGLDPLLTLMEYFQSIPEGRSWMPLLQQVHNAVTQKESIRVKHAAIQQLFKAQLGIPLPDAPLLQGHSLFTGPPHQLSRTLLTNLQRSFQPLFGLSQAGLRSVDTLQEFKRRFYGRYEEREIPLALALDAESGIGYESQPLTGDNPLIQSLLKAGQPMNPDLDLARPELDQWLRTVYDKWLPTGQPILELTDKDLIPWSSSTDPLSESYYAFGYFLSASAQALDAGDYRFRSKLVAGPSAFPLLGRFCRVDRELSQKVRDAFRQQQKQETDRIYAEIVHLPMATIGNVVQRPHLSDYEIPYLGSSTLPIDKQIPLDDLWVSVPKGERIVLRSRRLGKEIIPRLTTAHNYHAGLPTYRFLCDLQQQESNWSLFWQWGSLSTYRYLPRVQYRKIILQEAQWRLTWSDYLSTRTEAENISAWRQAWHWPRFITLAQADQELFLDLDHSGCQQLLLSTLRRLQVLHVFEWLRTPDQCPVEGPDGKLTHEVILPFRPAKTNKGRGCFPVARVSINPTLPRTFIPGSEWLYLKLYGGPQVSRHVLVILGKLARAYTRSKTISHWFFIRYQDPEPHLRFRFHVPHQASYGALLLDCQRQLQPLIDSGEIHRVQLDTYQRELERYGAERIEATEWIFWADSDAVLSISQDEPTEQMRLAVALLGVNAYFIDFGFTLEDKVLFCQKAFQSLFDQQGAQASLRKQLATLYRQNQPLIYQLLSKDESKPVLYVRYTNLFKQRSSRIKASISLPSTNAYPLASYLSSLIHMYVNRLFEQHQRPYELVVYHHLLRYFQSQVAQSR